MRIFTAVELPDAIRDTLDDRLARLLGSARGIQTVAKEHPHVTVRFLGVVDPRRISVVLGVLKRATGSIRSTNVGVRGLGAFPRPEQPRVLWAGLKDPHGTLAALEAAHSEELAALGYERDDRPFKAHVTLARIRKGQRPEPRFVERLVAAAGADEAFGAFPVERITVYESQLGRGPSGGPLYSPLARFPLRTTNHSKD